MRRASARRTTWGAAAATAVLLCAGVAPAEASPKLDSFAGSCSFQGTTSFSPPATNTQQQLTTSYAATGTCSGTLNGRKLSNARVKLHQSGHADASCLRASTTEPGGGALTFPGGTTIRYAFTFTAVLTEVDFTFHGERSGTAPGHGTFLTQRTPPDVPLQCAGKGIAKAPMDMSLSTDSPLISERRKGGGGGPPRAVRWSSANTFSGSCQASGVVAFKPALSNTPRLVKQRVRASGSCSGTFVDVHGRTHDLTNSPVTFEESSQGENASCAAGTPTGSGSLRFRWGELRFALSERRATAIAIVTLTGRESGSASGFAAPSQSENPAAAVQQCAGAGIKQTRIDAHLTTTPSISG